MSMGMVFQQSFEQRELLIHGGSIIKRKCGETKHFTITATSC